MALELYILPPFQSHPSLSGSCIAALTLCNLVLDSSDFVVVESTDTSIGMPALKDHDNWIRGFAAIRKFLSSRKDIDASLSPTQRADATAWASLIDDLGETLTVMISNI